MSRTVGLCLAVGTVAFLGYLFTLCPTVYTGDSGELAWAASSLGLAHPPGYPLWTLLGRVAVAASAAPPAVVLNGFSALASAGAAGLMFVLLFLLTGRGAASAAGALALAWSRGVWKNAVVTEVYALNLMLTAAALAAALGARRGRPRLFLLAAYVLGLGAGNHPLVLLAGIPVAVLALAPSVHLHEETGSRLRRLVPMAGAFLLGLTVYLYLPVRLKAGPEMAWGAPRSAADLLGHVLRSQYGGLGEASAVSSLATRWRVFAAVLERSVPWPFLLAGAVGLAQLARTGRPKRAGLVVLLFVLAGPTIAAGIRYQDTPLDRSVVTPYFLTAVMAAYLAFGIALALLEGYVAAKLGNLAHLGIASRVLLATLVPVFVHEGNARACNRRSSTMARLYAETALRSLPKGARLFAMGDAECFSLAYLHFVEGVRPDVLLADRTMNLALEAYGSDLLPLDRRERKARRAEREVEIAFGERERPIFYTERIGLGDFGGCRLVPSGLLYQLLRPGEVQAPVGHEPLVLPRVDPEEFLETHLAASALFREGEWFLRTGGAERARKSFERAAWLAERDPPVLKNLGAALVELGDLAAAEDRFVQALRLEPQDQAALYQLARVYSLEKRTHEALELYDRLVALGTELPEVHVNRGLELVRLGRLEEAGQAAAEARKLDPELEVARKLQEAVERGIELGGEAGLLQARRMLEPMSMSGTLELAQRYLERGEIERATDLYREASREAPENVLAAYGLGYGLLRVGRYEEAAETFRKILALEPGNADGRNALAYVLAQMGDSLERAEALVEEALGSNPQLASYYYDTLGWVRYRAGKHEAALEALRKSERALPQDDVSMRAENAYHLGVVLMALGRRAEAAECFRRSLRVAQRQAWLPDLRARARELGLEEASS